MEEFAKLTNNNKWSCLLHVHSNPARLDRKTIVIKRKRDLSKATPFGPVSELARWDGVGLVEVGRQAEVEVSPARWEAAELGAGLSPACSPLPPDPSALTDCRSEEHTSELQSR